MSEEVVSEVADNVSNMFTMQNLIILVAIVLVVYIAYTYMNKPQVPMNSGLQPGGPAPIQKGSSNGAKLKMFYSPQCGFCQKQKKVLEENNLMGSVEMVDCSRNSSMCGAEKIEGVPAFKTPSGKKTSGLKSAEDIIKLIQS